MSHFRKLHNAADKSLDLQLTEITDKLNRIFENDGTLVFSGDATVWDDLPPMLMTAARAAGVNVPTLTAFVGNIYLLTFAVNDYVFAQTEVVHNHKEFTDMECHIHLATNGLEATNKYVKYELEYWLQNIDAAAATATATISQEFMIPANTATRTHLYFDFSNNPIDGSAIKIGAYFCCRLRRIAATGAAPAAAPFVIAIGIHHEIDTVGSRTEHAK